MAKRLLAPIVRLFESLASPPPMGPKSFPSLRCGIFVWPLRGVKSAIPLVISLPEAGDTERRCNLGDCSSHSVEAWASFQRATCAVRSCHSWFHCATNAVRSLLRCSHAISKWLIFALACHAPRQCCFFIDTSPRRQVRVEGSKMLLVQRQWVQEAMQGT